MSSRNETRIRRDVSRSPVSPEAHYSATLSIFHPRTWKRIERTELTPVFERGRLKNEHRGRGLISRRSCTVYPAGSTSSIGEIRRRGCGPCPFLFRCNAVAERLFYLHQAICQTPYELDAFSIPLRIILPTRFSSSLFFRLSSKGHRPGRTSEESSGLSVHSVRSRCNWNTIEARLNVGIAIR